MPNKRLRLAARVDYGMNLSFSAPHFKRTSLGATCDHARIMRLTVLLAGYVLAGANRIAAQTTVPARFESKRIAAYSDSFATIVQGQERGWHTFSMQRTDS